MDIFIDTYTKIYDDISYFIRDIKQSGVTRQNAKNTSSFSSFNKCWTENVLNWSPILFLWLLQCCQTSFNCRIRTTFQRSCRVVLARCALHGALSCMNTKSPDLNRWENNRTKMGRDRWPNNIEGYVDFAVEKASSSSCKAGWGPIIIQHGFS